MHGKMTTLNDFEKVMKKIIYSFVNNKIFYLHVAAVDVLTSLEVKMGDFDGERYCVCAIYIYTSSNPNFYFHHCLILLRIQMKMTVSFFIIFWMGSKRSTLSLPWRGIFLQCLRTSRHVQRISNS